MTEEHTPPGENIIPDSSKAAGAGASAGLDRPIEDETPSQAGRVQFGSDPSIPVQPHANVTPGTVADPDHRAVVPALLESPLSEQTMRELHEIAGRYPQSRSALLPMLHLVQSSEGYVSPAGIEACAQVLGLTPAEVAGVATFYTMYKRRPIGDYAVGVCTNTLCAVMGGDEIFERLKSHLDVGNDETTSDGKVTLEHIECNAACDYAPVVMVNWEFFDNQTPQSAIDLVDDLRTGQEVTSTRGARLCTWRQAERVLAGFPDDRADEGPVGGPATLVGLNLARSRGWSAPSGESSGRTAGRMTTMDAASESVTHRAESETVAAEDTSAGDTPTTRIGDRKDAP